MKAFVLAAPDQPAALTEIPDPEPADDRIVVRVRAASVNGFDIFQAGGYLASMMPHDFPTVVGRDFAGVVESVGTGWSDVEIGDEVLGFVPSTPPLKVGAFGELVGGSGLVIAGKPSGAVVGRGGSHPARRCHGVGLGRCRRARARRHRGHRRSHGWRGVVRRAAGGPAWGDGGGNGASRR